MQPFIVSTARVGSLAALVIALELSATQAQGRPSTVNMTCGQAAALVARSGAVVLGTGGYTFDRFVAHRGFCEVTQVTKRAFVPARDTRACLVGYTCVEPGRDDFWDGF